MIRLCRCKDRFVIDRVKAGEINSDELGEVLSDGEQEESTVQTSYPLYSMSERNLVTADLRHAWYIIDDPVGDEATIALSGDTAKWASDELLSGNLGKLHLYHYYDHERDVGLWDPDEIDGREWCFPVRYEEYDNDNVSADALQYVSLGNLTMYIADKLSI